MDSRINFFINKICILLKLLKQYQFTHGMFLGMCGLSDTLTSRRDIDFRGICCHSGEVMGTATGIHRRHIDFRDTCCYSGRLVK